MSPKGLSHERVLDAALQLVDAKGIEALSMRALGRSLGVEAMSLYRYVANKDELLDALQERVVQEMKMPQPGETWVDSLDAMVREFRRVLATHPRAIPLFVRPATGANALEVIEAAWAVLYQAGFKELDALRAVHSLLAFVVGQALWQFGGDESRIADDEFEFGLDALLLGLEQRQARSNPDLSEP